MVTSYQFFNIRSANARAISGELTAPLCFVYSSVGILTDYPQKKLASRITIFRMQFRPTSKIYSFEETTANQMCVHRTARRTSKI